MTDEIMNILTGLTIGELKKALKRAKKRKEDYEQKLINSNVDIELLEHAIINKYLADVE